MSEETALPTFEYACDKCEVFFEELHVSRADVEKYSKEHPCPACGNPSQRIPSAANFTFSGPAGSDPTSGRTSSGSHDLDYPSLDKAIGRSANRKWRAYEPKKAARDQLRRETGSVAIMETREGPKPMDASSLAAREKGLSMFKKAREG